MQVRLHGRLADEQLPPDVGVGQSTGDEAQDVELAGRELGSGRSTQPVRQAGCDRRCEHRLTPRGASDGVGQHAGRGVLEEVAAGARLDGPDDVGIRVVGGQDEDLRGVGPRGDPGRRLGAVHDRHPQVHEHDVGTQPRHQRERLGAVGGLADHLEVALLAEHRDHAGPHQGVVVDDEQPDHRGTTRTSVVPPPGSLSTCTAPPTSAARACTPSRPKPERASPGSKPCPSSRTVSTTSSGRS